MTDNLTDRQKLGVAILIGVAVTFLVWWLFVRPGPEPDPGPGPELDPITVTGYGGSLKVAFIKNPEVAQILDERYKLTVDIEARSTLELLCDIPLDGVDFLWAGDQTQIEAYKSCRQRSDGASNTFVSPVVLYSWADTTDALVSAGVVRAEADGTYRADMVGLTKLMENELTWRDLGLTGLTSPIVVETTDPNASTSGGHFAALLANSMNCMDVVNSTDVEPTLPGIHDYFARLGYMPTKSAELFKLYISIGKGSYALVALYEAQIVEFMSSNPEAVNAVKNDLRMIYPEPTVWITNPIITLTSGGKRLRDALLDPDIQRLAWENNGFRPVEPSVRPDLSIVPLPLPAQISAAIDIPADPVMNQIKAAAAADYIKSANPPPRRACDDTEQPAPSNDGTITGSPVAWRESSA